MAGRQRERQIPGYRDTTMNTFPRTSRHGRSRYATQGTTLVELMVALVLGLPVVSVVGYAYVGSKQAFRMQDATLPHAGKCPLRFRNAGL